MQRTVPGTGELLLVSRKTFRTRPADPAAGARFRVVVLYFRDLYRMGSPRSRPVDMNFMVCIYRYIYRHIFHNIYVYIYIYMRLRQNLCWLSMHWGVHRMLAVAWNLLKRWGTHKKRYVFWLRMLVRLVVWHEVCLGRLFFPTWIYFTMNGCADAVGWLYTTLHYFSHLWVGCLSAAPSSSDDGNHASIGQEWLTPSSISFCCLA